MNVMSRSYAMQLSNDIGLTKEQYDKLIKLYCLDDKFINDKVLYIYNIMDIKSGHIYYGEGMISKKKYKHLEREFERNPDKILYRKRISDCSYLNIKFQDISFGDNENDIDDFYNNNEVDDLDIFFNINSETEDED